MDIQSIFTTITTSTIVTGLITLTLNSWVKSKINMNYDQKIERFKDEIAKLTESRKLDFERKLHDFSLYSSKRHEIYPETYKLLMESKRSVLQCNTGNEIPLTLSDNPKALYIYLEDMGVPEEKRNELLINWGINKNQSLYEMGYSIFLIKTNDFSNLINKARDYFYTNEIYFSEELAGKLEYILNEFQTLLSQLILKIELAEVEYPYSLVDRVELELKYIRSRIKEELAIADYDVNKN